MQHPAWVIAPLLLVVVLVWSGAAKAGRGASLRSIVANLRLPSWFLPPPLSRAVPWIELALALGLMTPWLPVFRAAAVLTLGLMAIYWLLIARGLTLTPRPQCGCFGMAGNHRITWRTLVRNSILVGVAAASAELAWTGRTAWTLVSDFDAGDRLWFVLTLLAMSCIALILAGPSTRTLRNLFTSWPLRGRAPAAPPAAESGPRDSSPSEPPAQADDYVRLPTPRAVLVDAGAPRTLAELSAQRAQLLVFVDCYCHSSQVVATELAQWSTRMPAIDVRLVFSIPHDPATRFGGVVDPLLDHAGLAWEALGLTSSPSAVLLGADGMLAGGPVAGLEEVQQFVAEIELELAGAQLIEGAHPDGGEPEGDVARGSEPASAMVTRTPDENHLVPEEQLTGDR